ncbi:MAG: pentapeptide repeat-containing protein, partial [Acidimicrobiales bacterium]
MATPGPFPVPPRLPAALTEADHLVLGTDVRWEAVTVRADFAGQVAEDFEVSGRRLSSASFSGAQLVRARLSDTVFERCDLSAA